MQESEDLMVQQAYLVARGVRPLALLEPVGRNTAEMFEAWERVRSIAGAADRGVIPFVFPREDSDSAMVGFASHHWVIDLLQWTCQQTPQQYHRIIGLLLGYSSDEIAEHDNREFAGFPIPRRGPT